MDEGLKQRLVGAAVLVLLAVIFIPMILDQSPEPVPRITSPPIPSKSDQDFSSRIIPLDPPRTPMVEARRSRLSAAEPAAPAEEAPNDSDGPDRAGPTAQEPVSEAARSVVSATTEGPTAWAVQLGSFSSAQNAVALRDRLRKKGYTAFVEKAESHGGEVTRVFVGPALAREQADEVVKKLYAETKLKGIVVKYPGS